MSKNRKYHTTPQTPTVQVTPRKEGTVPTTLPTTTKSPNKPTPFNDYKEHIATCRACEVSRATGYRPAAFSCQQNDILYYLTAMKGDYPTAAKMIAERYPPDLILATLKRYRITSVKGTTY